MIPSLLLGLGSPVRSVRKGCLNCMKVLRDAVALTPNQSQLPLFSFLEAAFAHFHEIVADETGVVNFLKKYFCSQLSQSVLPKGKKGNKSDNRDNALECLVSWFTSLLRVKPHRPPYHIMLQFLHMFRQVNSEVQ